MNGSLQISCTANHFSTYSIVFHVIPDQEFRLFKLHFLPEGGTSINRNRLGYANECLLAGPFEAGKGWANIGIELAGAKNHKTAVAVLEHYPKEKKIEDRKKNRYFPLGRDGLLRRGAEVMRS